jgi:hypothetical protein
MADIFISFIHEDEKVADGVKRFLHEKLEANNKVFLASDKWAIYAGEDWLKKMPRLGNLWVTGGLSAEVD